MPAPPRRVFLTAQAKRDPESLDAERWGVRPNVKRGDVVLFYVSGRGLGHAAVATSDAQPDEEAGYWMAAFDPAGYRVFTPPVSFAKLESHPKLEGWKPLQKPYPMARLDESQPGPLEGPVLRAVVDLIADVDTGFEGWLAECGVEVPPATTPLRGEEAEVERPGEAQPRAGVWITIGKQEENQDIDLLDLQVGQKIVWAVPAACRRGDWLLFWVTGSGFRYLLQAVGEPREVGEGRRGPVQIELEVRDLLGEAVTWKMLSDDAVLSGWDVVSRRMEGAIRAQTASLLDEPKRWQALKSLLLRSNPQLEPRIKEIEGKRPPRPEEDVLPELERSFIADEPTTEDHLGYDAIVDALSVFLSDSNTQTPLTLAIDAPWGAGKSSIMQMLRERLLADQGEPIQADTSGVLDTSWSTLLRELGQAVRRSRRREPSLHANRQSVCPPGPRRFEVVYFNAWRHGTGDRLTASLVHHVMNEIADRRSLTGRELFWLRLHLRRIDPSAVRRAVWQQIAQRMWGWLTGIAASLLAAVGSIFAPVLVPLPPWGPWAGFAVFGGAALELRRRFRERLKEETASIQFDQYFRVPDYGALMGPQPLIENDFQAVADDLRSQGKTLLVFVDDLDRCRPSQITAIVESINVFFGQKIKNCIFVLGMHRELVATSLELDYEGLVDKIKDNPVLQDELPFGRRFLDKISQFVVTLPEPEKTQVDRFINHLVGAEQAVRMPARVRRAADQEITPQLDRIEGDDAERNRVAEQLSSEHGVPVDAARSLVDERISTRRALDRARRFDERDPEAVRVFRAVRPALRANPRQYVRFFNALRFEYHLEAARLKSPPPPEALLVLAKQVVLSLEWPDLWNRICRSPDEFSVLQSREPTADDLRKSLEVLYEHVPGHQSGSTRALIDSFARNPRLLGLIQARSVEDDVPRHESGGAA